MTSDIKGSMRLVRGKVVSGNPSPWQRATTRNGALWKKDGKIGVFGPPPPTARQIENWQPVVYFPGNNAVFGLWPPLWRAVVDLPAATHLGNNSERIRRAGLAKAQSGAIMDIGSY